MLHACICQNVEHTLNLQHSLLVFLSCILSPCNDSTSQYIHDLHQCTSVMNNVIPIIHIADMQDLQQTSAQESAPESSSASQSSEQPTEGRVPEGATVESLPEQAMPAASQSHMGTGSTTPSHVTDDSNPSPVTEAPAPNPTPAYLPTSPTSVTSPHALSHMDSHRSTQSHESTGSNGNLAMSQSKEQSRQLLEKASQKLASLLVNANDKNFDATRRPGEAAIRRAPQVGLHRNAMSHYFLNICMSAFCGLRSSSLHCSCFSRCRRS